MRRTTALACSLMLLVAGCGGGDEGGKIPARQAEAMITQLDQIQAQVDSGACNGARDKVEQLEEKVAALPGSVSQEVRDNVSKAVSDLRALVQNDCGGESTEPATTEETTTETTPPTTESTPTETTESTPTETQPTETQPPPPPTDTLPTDTTPGNGGAGPPGQEKG